MWRSAIGWPVYLTACLLNIRHAVAKESLCMLLFPLIIRPQQDGLGK